MQRTLFGNRKIMNLTQKNPLKVLVMIVGMKMMQKCAQKNSGSTNSLILATLLYLDRKKRKKTLLYFTKYLHEYKHFALMPRTKLPLRPYSPSKSSVAHRIPI